MTCMIYCRYALDFNVLCYVLLTSLALDLYVLCYMLFPTPGKVNGNLHGPWHQLCLECRQNDWSEKFLREAFKSSCSGLWADQLKSLHHLNCTQMSHVQSHKVVTLSVYIAIFFVEYKDK